VEAGDPIVSRLLLDHHPRVHHRMVTVLMPKHPESSTGGPTDSDLQGYGNRLVAPNLIQRTKLPSDGRLPLRQQSGISAQDIEQAPLKYMALALTHLHEQIASLAKMAQDNSRPVDEYTPQTLSTEAESLIYVQPDWDMDELIESVVIVGPPGNVQLQLGDRTWPLTIPATGFIVIAPIAMRLSRSDNRFLTASAAGNYTVELMGHADNRGGA
jgi:hypothetical protein